MYITIATVICVFTILLTTKWSTSFVFLFGVTILIVTGVLPAKSAFAGFSSTSVIVVALLFFVVTGLEKTGVLNWVCDHLLGKPKTYINALFRLMIPVSFLSSILSNTTVVAMYINIVTQWSKKLKISASKLLIPLSYASILGGACTLIGTPPNLIISGMYFKETGNTIGFFDITPLGIVCLIIGYITILIFNKLLPNRKSAAESFENAEDYTVELLVPTDSELIGQTIKEANLIDIDGGNIIEIQSFDGEIISPVRGDEFLMGGDRLVYTGDIEKIISLKNSHHLQPATNKIFAVNYDDKNRTLVRAVVPMNSSLVGRSLSEMDFEEKHDLVVVALSRAGKCISGSPRKEEIQAGDSLLIECKNNFKKHATDLSKSIVITSEDFQNTISPKTIVSSLIMIGMVGLTAFGVMSLVEAALIAVFAMILTRCCSVKEGQKNINWDVIIIFACSLALGTALQTSGVAKLIADALLSVSGSSPLVALGIICLVTSIMTEFISNTAASAMIFPIAFSTATTLAVNPLPFVFGIMIASSSSFATPIGSPTHIMIYAPGGYRFIDFFKIGIIMNLVILATTLIVAPLLWPF